MYEKMHRPRPVVFLAVLLAVALCGAVSCSKAQPAEQQETPPAGPESAAAATNGAKAADTAPSTAELGAEQAAPAGAAPASFVPGTERQKELLQGAMGQLQAGEEDMAAMQLLTLVGEGPNSTEKLIGYVLLAEVYKAEDKPQKGIDRLAAALETFPATVELPLALAELYEAADRNDDALASLELAVQVAPTRLDLLARRVHMVVDAKADSAAAHASYDDALQKLVSTMLSAETPALALVELIQPLSMVGDPRLVEPLVALLAHPRIEVVAAAAEVIVNTGAVDAIAGIRAHILTESRAEIAKGLEGAVAYLEQLKAPPDVLVMPYAAAAEEPEEAH